jgi:hypothetical protein
MRCVICGCTKTSACHHPDAGPCAWYSQKPPICDICADASLFQSATQPVKNVARVKIVSRDRLRNIFTALCLFKLLLSPAEKEVTNG